MIDALRGEHNGGLPTYTTRLSERTDARALWVFKARLRGNEVARQDKPAPSWRPLPESCVGSLVIADTISCVEGGEVYLTGQDVPEGLAIGIGGTAIGRLEVISHRAAVRIPSGMIPDYNAIEAFFAEQHPADIAAMAAASQNHNVPAGLALVN